MMHQMRHGRINILKFRNFFSGENHHEFQPLDLLIQYGSQFWCLGPKALSHPAFEEIASDGLFELTFGYGKGDLKPGFGIRVRLFQIVTKD